MRVMILSGSRADLAYLIPVAEELRKLGADTWIESLAEVIAGEDTPKAIASRAGRILSGGGMTLEEKKPDMLVVLGDRWEVASACLAASLADVPIAHLAAGDTTLGAYDNKFRAAIEGLSTLHFPFTRTALDNLHRKGYSPVLAGCTSIKTPLALSQGEETAIIALYPETAGAPLAHLIKPIVAMCEERCLKPLVFGANADVGSNAFKGASLPPDEFHDWLYHATVIIGNSSAGIIEAPILGTPTVNIGTRQDGRPKARSIFTCHARIEEIAKALDEALAFGKQRVVSEYENEEAAQIVAREIVRWLSTSARKPELTTTEAMTKPSVLSPVPS